MEYSSQNAVGQVLKEAGEHDRFFDLSDAERLTWMIERAFALGAQSVEGGALNRQQSHDGAVRQRQSPARPARGQGRRNV
jgi:hypothetical protein